MHIGVAGPANPSELVDYLHPNNLPVLPGMGGTPVNILVRALLDLGHQVTLATLDPSLSVGDSLTLEGPALTVEIGPYRPRHRARDFFAVERASVTQAFIRQRPEAISAHWSYEFALGAIKSGIPTLVTVRDVPWKIFRNHPTVYRLARWLMHWRAILGATELAFNSPYTKESVWLTAGKSGTILPNAIPDRHWVLRDRPAPDPDNPLVVSVNNGFGPRKNTHMLIRAFASLLRGRHRSRMQLIGSGYERGGAANQWALKHGFTTGIEFIGPLSYADTLERIRQADLLVHPSLEESFGYTLIEAASVGTPVIGGHRSGAVPWVLGHGKYGVLVDIRSAEAIARGIAELVDDPVRWNQLRVAAFESGKVRFSSTSVANQYVEVLKRMGGARTARPG